MLYHSVNFPQSFKKEAGKTKLDKQAFEILSKIFLTCT